MRARFLAAAVGVSAGLSASLPSFVCTGAPCSSCFACVGAGGAVVSALLVGLVTRSRAARIEATRRPPPRPATEPDGANQHAQGPRDTLDLPVHHLDHRRKP